jgi:hypothetical protein
MLFSKYLCMTAARNGVGMPTSTACTSSSGIIPLKVECPGRYDYRFFSMNLSVHSINGAG